MAYTASGSLVYISDCPNINGGLTMNMIPAKTSSKLIISDEEIFSFRKILAWIVVNIGEVADIIIQSAKGKC